MAGRVVAINGTDLGKSIDDRQRLLTSGILALHRRWG
jgi:hypothetical protein